MSTVCELHGCPHLVLGHGRYCSEHIGVGGVIDAIDNLAHHVENHGGYVEQVVAQLDRVERALGVAR